MIDVQVVLHEFLPTHEVLRPEGHPFGLDIHVDDLLVPEGLAIIEVLALDVPAGVLSEGPDEVFTR